MMATENETDGLMQQSQGNYWTEIDRLRAELTNARLERDNLASLNSSLIAELAEAKARIASLEEELASTRFNFTGLRNATTARIAELAEANDHLHNLCAEKHARAKRAEAALSFYADERNWHTPPHCYSAAVSDCGTKARAALAPSPAGRDCGCEDASKCWGGSPGIKCRRPFPSPAGREE